ncbi:MAG: hypothetical protein A6F71_00005 [Cycloclasticus sp. symbiont of Poecilosclerida sp. M]|nr:MAG: hypothetical protein A6F71_00005 [Cycloclasticus sp. symbiont of Poecilosclerida sp. M]
MSLDLIIESKIDTIFYSKCSEKSRLTCHDPNILLTFDKVNALIGQDAVIPVGARPVMQHKKLHIKSAVSLPAEKTFVRSGRSNVVASVLQIRELINNAGIKADSHIVVYGDKNFLHTARLFWLLETFG